VIVVVSFDHVADEIDALSRNPDVLDRGNPWFQAEAGMAVSGGSSANLILFSDIAELAV